jgi:GNAT superfamily N-acetyltransferase
MCGGQMSNESIQSDLNLLKSDLGGNFIVAYSSGEAVGFIMYFNPKIDRESREAIVEVQLICVHASNKGKGIATELLRLVQKGLINYTKDKAEVGKIKLHAIKSAQSFYSKLGFSEQGMPNAIIKHWYSKNVLTQPF